MRVHVAQTSNHLSGEQEDASTGDVQETTDGEDAPEQAEEEEVAAPLPTAVSPAEPKDGEEDLRCRDMCTRLDHCGGLDSTDLDVDGCTGVCHSWSGWFQTQVFQCTLNAEAQSCEDILACYDPGPG